MGMAQLSVRPKSEQKFLQDQNLIVVEGTRTSSGVFLSRTIADGQTFTFHSCRISLLPTTAIRGIIAVTIEFNGVVLERLRYSIDHSGSGTSWQYSNPFNCKGIQVVGDGVAVLEVRLANATNIVIEGQYTGYETNT